MKYSKKLVFSALIFIICVLASFCFHTVPESQLWKGYKILYVKSEKLSEDNIYSILLKNKCTDVVSRVNQKIPISSKMAPVQVQSKNSYLFTRDNFFTDKSKEFSVFYVPDKNAQNLSAAVLEIKGYPQTTVSTDSGSVFPWICPVITIIFAGFLLYLTKKRLNLALVFIPLVLLSIYRPWYTVCAAICPLLLADFLLVKIYERKGIFNDLTNGLFILPLVALPLLVLFFSSALSAFLSALSFCGGWALLTLYRELYYLNFFNSSQTKFSFVYIKNSSAVKTVNKKTAVLLPALFACIVILFAFSSVFRGISAGSDSSVRPALPGPLTQKSKISENSLPDLTDFMDWSWQTVSFPFRKLNSSADEKKDRFGETVFIPEYAENADGQIYKNTTKVLSYDSSFVRSIYDKLEENDYPSLEKLMLSQGKNTTYGYTKNTGTSSEKAVSFVLIFLAAIPLILFLYFIASNIKDETYI